jgi:hypothetical protein
MNHNSAGISQSGRTCKACHFTIYRWDCVEVPDGTVTRSCMSVQSILWLGYGMDGVLLQAESRNFSCKVSITFFRFQ